MTGIDMCLVNQNRHCDRCGEYMCGYGYFPGGDPRRFIPDEECSTEEERDLHRRHCFAAAFFGVVHKPSTVECDGSYSLDAGE